MQVKFGFKHRFTMNTSNHKQSSEEGNLLLPAQELLSFMFPSQLNE